MAAKGPRENITLECTVFTSFKNKKGNNTEVYLKWQQKDQEKI